MEYSLPLLLLVSCWLPGPALPAKILVLLPFPGYSHTMPFMPIFKELGNRGHQLTMITPFPQQPNPKGFTQVNVDLKLDDLMGVVHKGLGGTLREASGPLFHLVGFWPMCEFLTPPILEGIKELLPPPGTHFDLIITEPFFCMEPLLAASQLYNAPVVATLPAPLTPTVAALTGNPLAVSYVPHVRLSYMKNMNFLQRAWNTVICVFELIGNQIIHFPQQDRLMRSVLDQAELPYLGDLLQNISLVLTETHFSLNYPRPVLRNVVEVGGVSIEKVKPLRKDLEAIMNDAKDGVIYFSLGSHFNLTDPKPTLKGLMETFSKLKQKVLFKWLDDIPNKPPNVLVQKWFPQPAILNHKNMLLFVSHGGLNSIYEAAYFGVPVVGIPLFSDQMHNIKILEEFGMAVTVDFDDIADVTTFSSAVNRILTDKRYKEKAVKRSAALRDRPQPVLDEAVYWVEYVLKHGGQDLKPRSLPWYSFTLLDVTLFLGVILITPILLLCLCLRHCMRSRKVPNKPVSSKKKE